MADTQEFVEEVIDHLIHALDLVIQERISTHPKRKENLELTFKKLAQQPKSSELIYILLTQLIYLEADRKLEREQGLS